MPSSVRLQWARKPARAPSDCHLSPASSSSLRVVAGDNLQALRALTGEFAERVTLAYVDPPFLTGKQHHRVSRKRRAKGDVVRTERVAFDDRWAGLGSYLDALRERLAAIRALLADHGSLVVHVDPKTSHYVKVMCDEIFGLDAFSSEIIWRYRRWPAKTANFQRVHDVLLRYVKNPQCPPRFNQLYEPLAPSTLATWGTRKQRAVTNKDGRRVRSSTTAKATPGAPMGDVWEIGIVAPVARERTGYPTQKPEALLSRLVSSLTDPGDWVLDPYLGSGTSLVTAAKLKRQAIGIDQSQEALEVVSERCEQASLEVSLQKVTVGESRVAQAS